MMERKIYIMSLSDLQKSVNEAVDKTYLDELFIIGECCELTHSKELSKNNDQKI